MTAHRKTTRVEQEDGGIKKGKQPTEQRRIPHSHSVHQTASQRAIEDPLAARQKAVLQLQGKIGNQAMGQLIAQTKQSEGAPGAHTQKMTTEAEGPLQSTSSTQRQPEEEELIQGKPLVQRQEVEEEVQMKASQAQRGRSTAAVRYESDQTIQRKVVTAGKADKVVLQSIAFALSRAGEIGEASATIEDVLQADFSTLKEGEVIYVVGHGSSGRIGGELPDAVKTRLLDSKFGVPPSLKEVRIMVLSCLAGKTHPMVAPTSAVQQLSEHLQEKRPGQRWIVVGGKGKTIKAPGLGPEMYVRPEPTKEGSTQQKEIEEELESKDLGRATLAARYERWVEKYKNEHSDEEPPIALRAIMATRIYWHRALGRVSLLREQGILQVSSDWRDDIVVFANGLELEDEEKEQVIDQVLKEAEDRKHELILPATARVPKSRV